jgi:hypothetical protein
MSPAPYYLLVEFFRPNGQALRLEELGAAFLRTQKILPGDAKQPFRVALEVMKSRHGNAFFQYEQHSVPLPDGLDTSLRVAGITVPMGDERPSQRGLPTREGSVPVSVDGVAYTATVYLTRGRSPYYIRVVVHKTPGGGLGGVSKLPKGGQIVV